MFDLVGKSEDRFSRVTAHIMNLFSVHSSKSILPLQDCSHCKYKNTNDERWTHQLIILAAEQACNGIYNFIVPLRSQFIGMKSLCPIILLLEEP